jgi:hypothetical protein
MVHLWAAVAEIHDWMPANLFSFTSARSRWRQYSLDKGL